MIISLMRGAGERYCVSHGLRWAASVRAARLKTVGSPTRGPSPVDVRQDVKEMWYKGGAGVSW